METIESKNGQFTWQIIGRKKKQCGQQLRTFFIVRCSICGWEFCGLKINIERKKKCPGCANKPAALKIDNTGACVAICDQGTIDFVRDYQEEHGASEREAVQHFVDTVKAKLSQDDPVLDSLTEESVRASVRRGTGKKKDTGETRGGPPQNTPINKPRKYRVEADVDSVQTFLNKHLPGYVLSKSEVDSKPGG